MQHTTLHRLVGIALLGAIAYILMLLEFPILPVAPWMKIDFSDIPILIGLFLFGVGGAFVITIIKLLLHSAMMGFAIYDLIGSFASFFRYGSIDFSICISTSLLSGQSQVADACGDCGRHNRPGGD
ncbi:Gx transporter family protein [Lactiplantibacillus plantarum]|uniref:ECF transporter S component n=1 Tax=Lactiplantibacillus plantarum TaxID=1590 RepID=UPI0007BB1AEF|nr:Gx transporter family protein [Lactiplantibacillus plantarum]KZU63360.1 Substrate-specific component RibU of riboflavinECF transporter [Lactiplantibacillus plantarum]MDC6095503.1 Gx transporter family protein [Lactiplantibacillus plantarum]MDC6108095.1 Gx transporter family protein [Lactiplantibacillus plantarum]